ncbi:hypothetical protein AURDEDRAFT_168030 [Auricularia subglabra TFB-10046 SS5]|nr:hypothetical protein AURDEDRAFT_168030 [Auricularia subglabra TFB-10046 SS5]
MEQGADQVGNERLMHPADELGMFDDEPTLSMLSDIENFLFTQRQRWFNQGWLYSWSVFGRELERMATDRPPETSHGAELHKEISDCLRETERRRKKLEETVEDCRVRISRLQFEAVEMQAAYALLKGEHDKTLAQLGSRRSQGYGSRLKQRAGSSRDERAVDLEMDAGSGEASAGEPSERSWDERMQRRTMILVEDGGGEGSSTGAQFQSRGLRDASVSQGVEEKRESGAGTGAIARPLDGDGDLAYYDPDAATYEQLTFISRALVKSQEEDECAALPEANFDLPKHYIWTLESLGLPIPLGRYSQPFFTGSAWEDFNPMRLWQAAAGEPRVTKGEELWVRLAIDAARLPFEYRSHAQRIVVSEAHRVQPPGWTRKVLPLPGDVGEVDVWHQCVNNALYMPLAVRRQYSYCRQSDTLYREWDAADLGIYVILRACGPEGETKKEKREKKEKHRRGVESGAEKSVVAQWTSLVREAVLWGAKNEQQTPETAHTGPRRYAGDGSPRSIFEHLLQCGFERQRMAATGDVYGYVVRTKELDEKLLQLKDKVEAVGDGHGRALEPKEVMARAKCLMELALPRIAEDRPIVRCKVKDGDPIGRVVREEMSKSRRGS